jgi:hypothetical protein
MRSGVSVYGNYRASDWTRCSDSTTRLAPMTARGVRFPPSITEQTILDGFVIRHFDAPETASISVEGAKGVLLSNLVVEGVPSGETSYGVNVTDGGQATVFRCSVDGGGSGARSSVGVRSVAARVSVQDSVVETHATDSRSRPSSYAVLLVASPGSRVEGSTVLYSSPFAGGNAAAIRIEGDAHDILVRDNVVEAKGGNNDPMELEAIRLVDCGDASPWIVDNPRIALEAQVEDTLEYAAIASYGACHPVVEANRAITAAAMPRFTDTPPTTAIRCGVRNGARSRCVIAENPAITGTWFSGQGLGNAGLAGMGIACDNGACARISDNRVTGFIGDNVPASALRFGGVGIRLHVTGAFVERNVIAGGCYRHQADAIGIVAIDSWSRIENNEIVGATERCSSYVTGNFHEPNTIGLSVTISAGTRELDVHSNFIAASRIDDIDDIRDARRNAGITLETLAGSVPQGPLGVFRNNVIASDLGMAMQELGPGANPRLLEHNLLTTQQDPYDDFPVYGDHLPAIDLEAGANIDGTGLPRPDPFRLDAGSPCVNAGTASGAPLFDIDGEPRDARPDIGPDELSN